MIELAFTTARLPLILLTEFNIATRILGFHHSLDSLLRVLLIAVIRAKNVRVFFKITNHKEYVVTLIYESSSNWK